MQRLPVVNFAAGRIATHADAALMMRLGADGVFVDLGIFKAENAEKMANAVVEAVNNFDNSTKLAEISKRFVRRDKRLSTDMIPKEETRQEYGW
jgi:pyridoxal 5'-phosphate synthase pdxS subunit